MSRDDKYKLPKIRVVGPIIAYTLVFILIIASIFAVVSILVDYMLDVRSEADYKIVCSDADIYSKATEEDRAKIRAGMDAGGVDYCILNDEGDVLYSHGKITCEGYDKKSNSFKISDLEIEDVEEIEDIEELQELKEETGIDVQELQKQTKKRFDTFGTGGKLRLEDTSENSSGIELFFYKAFKNIGKVFGSGSWSEITFSIPFWVGAEIGDSGQILLVKSDLPISRNDHMYFFGGLVMALVITLTLFIMVIANVVGNLSASKKLKKMMFRDNISRGHNWLWYVVESRKILQSRSNQRKTYAVVELVFVKYRNYVLCHSVKDAEALLRQVATIVRKNLGKDELCAHSTSAALPLLLRVNDEEDARKRLQDIITALENIPCGHKLAFQAGVYLVNPAKEKAAMKMRSYVADMDLYYNNACAAGLTIADSGESGIAFFDDKLVEQEKWADMVSERQQSAIDNEEFLVYYQPKCDPNTDELRGAEALVRWKTEDQGLIPPGRFIPIFEESGFITKLDHYMVSHVARDQKRWLDAGMKCVPVSVNISRAHFGEVDLADQIRDLVDKEGAPHDLIEIELTESAFFDDKNAMIDTITRLKSYGFHVSMDDFGSGYSSLNSLKDMPLDILKLDAGFFRGKNDSNRTETVVSAAIKLAKELNMQTVAEGVEEQPQVKFLAAEGCDMIQGYYYAKPMPGSEFESWINKADVDESTPLVDNIETVKNEVKKTDIVPDENGDNGDTI